MVDKLRRLWKSLGPGLITGASDDEPSAIATYSIAGAKYGYSMLWLALFSLPLMIAIQEMSARIGRISNRGLAGNMKRHYPSWLMILIAIIIVGANTINIGADMSGMAQAVAMTSNLPEKATAIAITFLILGIILIFPYQKIFTLFKWVSLTLFAYILASFTIHQDWPRILFHLFIPTLKFNKDYMIVFMAFMGTTLSPYLFFWQANQEVEEKIIEQCKPGRICHLKPATPEEVRSMDTDTRIGMSFSNLITFFIITLTASTLFRSGVTHIETLRDAAEALKPLAGNYAYALFTVGLLSSGFLAIPVLAGSAAYVIAEVFEWRGSFNESFMRAKEFYLVIITSTVIGLGIPLLGFHPVKALFYTSIIYAVISPLLIGMVVHMANNPKIVGKYVNSKSLNWFGYTTFWIMALCSVLVFFIF